MNFIMLIQIFLIGFDGLFGGKLLNFMWWKIMEAFGKENCEFIADFFIESSSKCKIIGENNLESSWKVFPKSSNIEIWQLF